MAIAVYNEIQYIGNGTDLWFSIQTIVAFYIFLNIYGIMTYYKLFHTIHFGTHNTVYCNIIVYIFSYIFFLNVTFFKGMFFRYQNYKG